jgi:hypothetical protein
MITIAAHDIHVEQLFEKMQRFHRALAEGGIPYRIVGGLAVFLQVSARDQDKARSTRDIDVAVNRSDLSRIIETAERYGFKYRHAAGIDMLVDAEQGTARSAVRLVFAREKVRPEYFEPVPFSEATITQEGILLAPAEDLVRMKLTSFRMKDRVHVQDMDSVGLITRRSKRSYPKSCAGVWPKSARRSSYTLAGIMIGAFASSLSSNS